MKLFKANDHTGHCLGIVLAATYEIAHAFFVGRNQIPNSLMEIDQSQTGLASLMIVFKTKIQRIKSWNNDTQEVLVEDLK